MPKVIFNPKENPKHDASVAVDLCNRIIDRTSSKAQAVDITLLKRKIRKRSFATAGDMLTLQQIEESLERLR